MSSSDILLIAALVAEGLVALGIYLESPKEKDRRQRAAFVCVFVGVLISAVATILLFVHDERVMSSQSGKIISLETELTPRRLGAAQEADIRKALEPYAGTPFSLAVAPAEEPFEFGQQLKTLIVSAHWRPFPFPIGDINIRGTGLMFGRPGITLAISSQELGLLPERTALARTLTAEGFKPSLMRFTDVPPSPEAGVMVIVGVKPLASFIRNKVYGKSARGEH